MYNILNLMAKGSVVQSISSTKCKEWIRVWVWWVPKLKTIKLRIITSNCLKCFKLKSHKTGSYSFTELLISKVVCPSPRPHPMPPAGKAKGQAQGQGQASQRPKAKVKAKPALEKNLVRIFCMQKKCVPPSRLLASQSLKGQRPQSEARLAKKLRTHVFAGQKNASLHPACWRI